ncbi:hypothetical protein KM1_225490 [Entamoeba histolytica HM-3:IMSS]|uniref:Uncharacterized protein n=5 Tax=Entamoeba histolytica TaxID=5759 RepID=C4MAH6_ENTH1|nr:hypothetical protein EHI_191740 [Entamoeba histolytica HM-1:IMSS]EMD49593.1 Hypothetical protein EHI5A_014240 [Entamoeba histolytica KU27]EMS11686.1 hypothetical protein KM1_225490 [Entamoeba histolytica HM-3:IMSS]ENY62538.1 hypothetical protein EHI7A_146250 [Entamoeba histolytica HM-1:IMSS-A]GAT98808.1 hypothetical protein CL6EHI_191740 [Entamoeba histolytica]EAL43628.1 hypothetical protein EHI_191740 [Entamoeba histolytica HM-1:IMSS]|eukprot:XP_649014.1 hypothetical protein EHI_191740 [Entamoeba histolytica HM-1:IMSS]
MSNNNASTKRTQCAVQNGLLALLIKENHATIIFKKPVKRRCKYFNSTPLVITQINTDILGMIDVQKEIDTGRFSCQQELVVQILKQYNYVITFKQTRKNSKTPKDIILQVSSLSGTNYKLEDLIKSGITLELYLRSQNTNLIKTDYSIFFS